MSFASSSPEIISTCQLNVSDINEQKMLRFFASRTAEVAISLGFDIP